MLLFLIKLLGLEVFWVKYIIKWNPDKLLLLLNKGLNPNAFSVSGDSLLSVAIRDNKLRAVEILIENGSDLTIIDEYGRSVLFSAVENSSPQILEQLCSSGVNVEVEDKGGFTALGWCVVESANVSKKKGGEEIKNDLIKCADVLLAHGASAKRFTKIDLSPLIMAIMNNELEFFRLFYYRDQDLLGKNANGLSAFDLINELPIDEFNEIIDNYRERNK